MEEDKIKAYDVISDIANFNVRLLEDYGISIDTLNVPESIYEMLRSEICVNKRSDNSNLIGIKLKVK